MQKYLAGADGHGAVEEHELLGERPVVGERPAVTAHHRHRRHPLAHVDGPHHLKIAFNQIPHTILM